MKKIRFCTTSLGGGGAERVLINILNGLDFNKYDVTVLLFEKSGVYLNDLPKEVTLQGILQKKDNSFYKIIYKTVFRLFMHFSWLFTSDSSKYDVDIAFLQDTTYLLRTSKAKKKIAWIHTDITRSPTFNNGLFTNLSHADDIVCVSDGVKNIIAKQYPEFINKLKTIYNPINITSTQELANNFKPDFRSDTKYIVAVGRLSPEKGFDLLIKAFSRFLQIYPDTHLIILGEGYMRSQLEEIISNLNIRSSVSLLGYVNNPYPYIKAADMFALSSRREGCPMVLIEAITLGTPIVATDCQTGPRDLLCDGKYGILVESENVDSLANGMISLMQDKLLMNSLEKSAITRANEFDITNIIKQIESLLDER